MSVRFGLRFFIYISLFVFLILLFGKQENLVRLVKGISQQSIRLMLVRKYAVYGNVFIQHNIIFFFFFVLFFVGRLQSIIVCTWFQLDKKRDTHTIDRRRCTYYVCNNSVQVLCCDFGQLLVFFSRCLRFLLQQLENKLRRLRLCSDNQERRQQQNIENQKREMHIVPVNEEWTVIKYQPYNVFVTFFLFIFSSVFCFFCCFYWHRCGYCIWQQLPNAHTQAAQHLIYYLIFRLHTKRKLCMFFRNILMVRTGSLCFR